MPNVTFRAKIETIYNPDETPAYRRIKVPALSSRHCDMHEFRTSKTFGGLANSDMFPALLKRAALAAGVKDYIRLDAVPPCATVDGSSFLALVTIALPETRP